ncbi:archease [bacterium]|nr:archease [candidate division CSSED10-310 bacterium]
MICPYGKIREIGTTADVGLVIESGTLELLFATAGWGMTQLITMPHSDWTKEKHRIDLRADDTDMLMVDWLSELLFIFSSEALLFSTYDIVINENRLQAQLQGNRVIGSGIRFRYDLKGVTWHNLVIRRVRNVYQARILFDV